MMRACWTWLAFACCLAAVSAAMGWVTLTTLRLEDSEAAATWQAENERLALWRMDSLLIPLINAESARPYEAYEPAPAHEPPSPALAPTDGELSHASPLLRHRSPFVVLHVQCEPGGKLTSPQVPLEERDAEERLEKAKDAIVADQRTDDRRQELKRLQRTLRYDELDVALRDQGRPTGPLAIRTWDATAFAQAPLGEPLHEVGRNADDFRSTSPAPRRDGSDGVGSVDDGKSSTSPSPQPTSQQSPSPTDNSPPPENESLDPSQSVGRFPLAQRMVEQSSQQRTQRSLNEYQRRAQSLEQNNVAPNASVGNDKEFAGVAAIDATPQSKTEATDDRIGEKAAPSARATYDAMRAVWQGDDLVLVRRVSFGDRDVIQGCLLDWPAIERSLLDEVVDLLPQAALVPVHSPSTTRQPLMLASLPAMLVPGRAPLQPVAALTPLRLSLGIAWGCLTLAAAAVAALLWGAIRLGERRGAFVSAVTHELRTPLTTFRLYAEMLATGRVATEEKRKQYLETLSLEAARLGHLVENVLSYARLEGARQPVPRMDVALPELLDRLRDPLGQLAERSGLTLTVDVSADPPPIACGDPGAIERILFNLVDNACKYATSATDRRIHVDCRRGPTEIELRVRDYGPGFPRDVRRRLFRPFSKSAGEAAHSAPGVGLGLALSRRLARRMHGDLRLDEDVADGACLVLTLPAAD